MPTTTPPTTTPPAESEAAQPATVYLGLGSNLGDRRAAIAEAVRRLTAAGTDAPPALADAVLSPIYETDAVAPHPEPAYLNAVLRASTRLLPEALLGRCLEIESEMGRVRPPQGGQVPRIIDIDLLLAGQEVVRTAALTLPHPRLLLRPFVLVPLADVAERGLVHPVMGVSLATATASPAVRKVTALAAPPRQ